MQKNLDFRRFSSMFTGKIKVQTEERGKNSLVELSGCSKIKNCWDIHVM